MHVKIVAQPQGVIQLESLIGVVFPRIIIEKKNSGILHQREKRRKQANDSPLNKYAKSICIFAFLVKYLDDVRSNKNRVCAVQTLYILQTLKTILPLFN